MPRKRRVITFSLPPEMDEQLRQVVEEEGRTVSELLREAFRLYLRGEGVAQTGTDADAALTPDRTGRDKQEEPMIERYDYTPAALYARVSSDRQDVDLSVAAQLRALRDYAEKNGYLVAREFIDEAESGRIADRPQFRKMIDEASRTTAPFKEILVWKFSRFTRKREHAVAFKSMLRRKGVRVVSITEHADDTPTGKLMEAIIESVDEFYSENLAQEVTRRDARGRIERLLGFQPRPLRLQPGHGAGRSQEETHPGDQSRCVLHRQAHVRHGRGR